MLLLLDFDGTLAPIVDHPDLALLPDETKKALEELSAGEKYRIGIVSSRGLADLKSKVGLPSLTYAGNHGLEIQGPGLEFVHPKAPGMREILDQTHQRLQEALESFEGAFVEHKGFGLTAHYRLAPDNTVEDIKGAVTAATVSQVESGVLLVTAGKKALEIRLKVGWDKGKTVSWLVDRLSEANPLAGLALYFGDDAADEAGFDAVQKSEGIGVFVGPDRDATCATHWLDSPEEVGEFLARSARS